MIPTISAINEADRLLHSLAQFIAQTAMQTLANQPDDSQANLSWNATTARLEGRPFGQAGQSVRLVIDTEPLVLAFLTAADQPIATLSVDGRTPAQVQAWWQDQMQTWTTTDFRQLNYQLDSPPIGEQTPYTRPPGLLEWAYWRTVSNETLRSLNMVSGQFSEVRIWPHHFDTGVYYSFLDGTGSERAAIWAGYAIADAIRAEPYFYLSGYSRDQSVAFEQAPALLIGEWVNTTNWKGALLPISEATNAALIQSFFADSYQWLFNYIHP